MTSPRILYDHQGKPVHLAQLKARGGEGEIYGIRNDAGLVAKVYLRPSGVQTAEKLRWLVRAVTPALRETAAWPLATLHAAQDEAVAGFLMPHFADALSIQSLYSPKERKQHFPGADWEFLIRAAGSCARAFAAVHAQGVVVGDVNQSNVLMSPQGVAALIDCDSFQVRADGRLFRCEVGVPAYTPPELQGRKFAEVVRTVNHDRFGLAVLLFHLLFMGRHPYAGVYDEPSEVPMEDLIAHFRFAYSRNHAALHIHPPPNVPTLDVLSPELAELFEKAFTRGSEAAEARPTAEQWQAALERFRGQLRPCPKDAGHKVPSHSAGCPWCAIVNRGGPNYFAGVAAVGAKFQFDDSRLAAVGQRLEAAPARGLCYGRPPLPSGQAVQPTPLPEEVEASRLLSRIVGGVALGGPVVALAGLCLWFKAVLVIGLIVGIGFGVWWAVLRLLSSYGREVGRRRQALAAAQRALEDAEAEVNEVFTDYDAQGAKLFKDLKNLTLQWQGLRKGYEAERQHLERNRESIARDHFLQTCLLRNSKIPKIGDTRKQTLASFGLETAHDLERDKILAIKGFGPALANALLEWKQEMIAEFRFDPASNVPQAELQEVALKYKQRQDSLRTQCVKGLRELEVLSGRSEQTFRPLVLRIQKLVVEQAQAEADLRTLSSARGTPTASR